MPIRLFHIYKSLPPSTTAKAVWQSSQLRYAQTEVTIWLNTDQLQITCLFWFESSFTLHWVEESKITPTPTTPLVTEAIPTMGFRKWVTTMLSTTQVTQNVILLALMFIYRLKKLNPTVKGRPGSEYRLLTVALMLGNKCEFLHFVVSAHFVYELIGGFQSWMIIPTPTRLGLKSPAFPWARFTLWRSNS